MAESFQAYRDRQLPLDRQLFLFLCEVKPLELFCSWSSHQVPSVGCLQQAQVMPLLGWQHHPNPSICFGLDALLDCLLLVRAVEWSEDLAVTAPCSSSSFARPSTAADATDFIYLESHSFSVISRPLFAHLGSGCSAMFGWCLVDCERPIFDLLYNSCSSYWTSQVWGCPTWLPRLGSCLSHLSQGSHSVRFRCSRCLNRDSNWIWLLAAPSESSMHLLTVSEFAQRIDDAHSCAYWALACRPYLMSRTISGTYHYTVRHWGYHCVSHCYPYFQRGCCFSFSWAFARSFQSWSTSFWCLSANDHRSCCLSPLCLSFCVLHAC